MRKGTLDFDLMKPIGRGNERFVATMRYPYDRLFKLDLDDLYVWILSKRPTLKGQVIKIYVGDTPITFHPKNEKARL